jgi:hypothetical protein
LEAKDGMKLSASTKGWIVKLYKAGLDINQILEKVRTKSPKITKTQIRNVARNSLIAQADDLWSAAVKVKFGWKCAISNKTDHLEAHHLVRRGNWTHRWTVENGISLNSYYHTLGSEIAAHGATDVTERFREWMIEYHADQWAWFVYHRNDPSEKPDIDELLEIVKRLEGETKNAYHLESQELGVRQKAVAEIPQQETDNG